MGILRFSFLDSEHIDGFSEIAKNAPDPWRRENLEEILASSHCLCYTAFYDNIPVAFASFFSPDENADLQMLVTAFDIRRKGIGEKLLTYALADLRIKGKKRCLLELRLSNSGAAALYEKLGFKQLALRKYMYQNPREDGVLMAKDL